MKNKCYWCDKKTTDFHKDHFLPFSLGGRTEKNLVLSCSECNQKKQNKLWFKKTDGTIIKSKKKAVKFAKVIEKEKFDLIVFTIVGISPKKNKIGRDLPYPKSLDLSAMFGEDITKI